jgi:hypothetical protein
MSFISREVLNGILKISSCVCKDISRPNLNGVRIKRHEDAYMLTSCDGHTLANLQCGTHIDKFLSFLEEGKSIVIEKSAIQRISILLKCYPKNKTFPCIINDNFLQVEVEGDVFSLKLNSREWPNTDKVVNENPGEGYLEFALNPQLLHQIGKAISVDKQHGCILKINPKEPLKPILVKRAVMSEANTFAVLMPMKV